MDSEQISENENNKIQRWKSLIKHNYWHTIVKPNFYPSKSKGKMIELDLQRYKNSEINSKIPEIKFVGIKSLLSPA